MASISVVLADDHVLIRKGIKRILAERGDLEVIGEAGDGLDLIHLLKQRSPDLILLDLSMPNLRGVEAIPQVRSICPAVKILVLTMHRDREFLYQAMAAGADGYLLKEDAEEELFSAIEAIRKKSTYISPSLAEESREDWVEAIRGRRKHPFVESLTNREREILKLIAEGNSSKEVAELLFISVHTVERHRANLMAKLGLKGTAELVKYAIEKKYI